jgi:nucleoid-associated protein YgaU
VTVTVSRLTAGKFSRVNLQSKILPDPADPDGAAPFLSVLDSAYSEFDDSLEVAGTHMVTADDAMDLPLISYRWYRNINLWWVIAAFNGIQDPWLEIQPGVVLKIPSLSSVEDYFRRVVENNSGNRRSAGRVTTLA